MQVSSAGIYLLLVQVTFVISPSVWGNQVRYNCHDTEDDREY